MKILYPKKYENFVKIYAEEYQVDENLIYAIIKAESNFNAQAVSSKGAKGLMQLMDKTAKDIAPENSNNDLLNIDTNIQLGTKYISILIERYDNIGIAVIAYNAGIGTVDTWIEKNIIKKDGSDIENVPYKETNQYVRKILRDYKIYQNIY